MYGLVRLLSSGPHAAGVPETVFKSAKQNRKKKVVTCILCEEFQIVKRVKEMFDQEASDFEREEFDRAIT